MAQMPDRSHLVKSGTYVISEIAVVCGRG